MLVVEKDLVTLNQDIAGQEIGIPVYRIFDKKVVEKQAIETKNATKSSSQTHLKKVYIQSAVHAAEMQGSAVIFRLIEQLKHLTLNAEFILVPNCNPFGRTQRAGEYLQGRYDATTGNNWNRFYHYNPQDIEQFVALLTAEQIQKLKNDDESELITDFKSFLKQSLTSKLDKDWGVNTAQFLNTTLQEFAVDADLVLDLHTGPSSTRHIYSPEFLATSAQDFNIENILSIPAQFAGALDEASFMPWVYLSELMAKQGVTINYEVSAFTVELGSQENICLTQAQEDSAGILNYLQKNNLIDGFTGVAPVEITTTLLKNYKTLFSRHAGMVEYLAKPGDKVNKGQVIARVLNSLEFDTKHAIVDVKAPSSGTIILHYPSAAVQVGTQLFKIAVN
ncbi:succinylglutamate desuccinylase/aspartoacylase family protein [uncultured Psychrosphaera sp.]|uniref:biotin/lipoyl-containing protein n=1 Tax=uncultured Psychrosphaera sp. TaxID=1403522 RepID=UPI00260710C7|nr:succinylglutamate desuccinylase/aspartoacylase family protein [uncultured Psychrosphaera sp.]